MRRLLFAALLGAMLAALPVGSIFARAAGVARLERVAVVDVQRVILETKEGKKAKRDLEKAFAKSQARLERKAEALQKRYQDLQAKAAMLSESKLVQRQQDLMRSQGELQQLQQELQEDIIGKEALLTEKIYKKVAAIVEQIALEEQVQIVLVRSEMTVLYVNPQLDLTNRVIVTYDKKYK
jgi:outer membrane protein